MGTNFRGKSPGYHNINNAKFCPKKEDGTPDDANIIRLPYSKTLALSPLLERQDVYADGRNVLAIPSDQGYEGSYGTTDQDIGLETALGFAEELAGGLGTLKMTGYRRGYMYYEFKRALEDGRNYVVKAWLYDAEFGKAAISNETDTNTLTMGTTSYPLRVYGTPALDDEGKPVTDELGNEKVVIMMISLPGDDDYTTFGDAVPLPKVKPPEETGEPEPPEA